MLELINVDKHKVLVNVDKITHIDEFSSNQSIIWFENKFIVVQCSYEEIYDKIRMASKKISQ